MEDGDSLSLGLQDHQMDLSLRFTLRCWELSFRALGGWLKFLDTAQVGRCLLLLFSVRASAHYCSSGLVLESVWKDH